MIPAWSFSQNKKGFAKTAQLKISFQFSKQCGFPLNYSGVQLICAPELITFYHDIMISQAITDVSISQLNHVSVCSASKTIIATKVFFSQGIFISLTHHVTA